MSSAVDFSFRSGTAGEAKAPLPLPLPLPLPPVQDGWPTIARPGFAVCVDPQRQSALAFALSVASGLDSRPRRLDASYLYDAAGSDLFERITEQPEYYLTRAEDRLLLANARVIRQVAGPGALVELGSGASTKTRRLLDAWTAAGPTTYVPIDVDAHAIEQACGLLREQYSQSSLALRGFAATYERGLAVLRGWAPMTVAFLGSSLGNLGWRDYPEFCQTIAEALAPGDHFLVGLDLVKAPADIEAAYNDAAGVTAAFTRNLFARMNRELGTDIADDAVEHVAFYDSERERIEIFAEARRELVIPVRALGREFRLARGERILTEVSHKFRPQAAIATVERFGFRLAWSAHGGNDQDDQAKPPAFGLFLFRREPTPARRRSRWQALQARAGVLTEMRDRTMQIVAPLGDPDLLRQHSPLMSPIAWDLGHITHFEEMWLLPHATEPADPESGLARIYDPLVTPRAGRATLTLPPVATIRQRMREVRLRVEARLASGQTDRSGIDGQRAQPVLDDGFALPLVAQHEAQHQETILQAIALREDLDYQPSFVSDVTVPRGSRPIDEPILIPGGPFVMGTDDRDLAYDNERPAHQVDVPAFFIDRAPVTNQRFFAFMADGGYRRRALWCDAGWAWLQRARAQSPAHWRLSGDNAANGSATAWARGWQALVFGRLQPLHPDHAVIHVCWFEAAAFARWAGGRLPTEAEWEKAAAWDATRACARRYPWGDAPWDPSRANLDQGRLAPTNAGAYPEGRSAAGCVQMLGDVWEWTDSWFGGYPGFESFPYKEYSEIFFGETYRVLRGASFATRALVARNTFRNWDLPERRQIFAGFRCARSP